MAKKRKIKIKTKKQNINRNKILISIIIGVVLIIPIIFIANSRNADYQITKSNAASAPSGQDMPLGDITGWKQVFTEDFTTDVPLGSFPAALSTKWEVYPDGWQDTSKNGTYNCTKVCSIQNGMLDLYLHSEGTIHYVAVPVAKIPGATGSEGGLLYGRYTVRFRADPVVGYKTAWLLWPDSEVWPADGEIDFPEGDLNNTISGFMHFANPSGGQDAFDSGAMYNTWHTATTEWTPGKVVFILDGAIIGTSTTQVPSKPMHWVLQTETAIGAPAPDAAAAGHVQVDWVSVYTPCPTCISNTISPSQAQNPPTPTNIPVLGVEPTFVCFSANPCVSPKPTLPPSNISPTLNLPTNSVEIPIVTNSQLPNSEIVPTSGQVPGSSNSGSGNQNLIQLILAFIMQIIQLILSLFHR